MPDHSPKKPSKRLITSALLGLAAAAVIGVITYGLLAQRRSPGSANSAASAQHASGPAACEPNAPCECFETAASAALDDARSGDAYLLLERAAPACRDSLMGLRAETLALAGKGAEARTAWEAALKRDPKQANARRAQAITAVQERRLEDAAKLLDALLAEQRADLRSRFQRGVVFHEQNRYNEARQNYLKVVHAHPRHIDARHRLVLLTHSAGVLAEARHHLKKLEEIAPIGDPRVTQASQLVAQNPNQAPPQTMILRGDPKRAAPAPSAK
jgi:tetratricopeptide (TPR) repeat protein